MKLNTSNQSVSAYLYLASDGVTAYTGAANTVAVLVTGYSTGNTGTETAAAGAVTAIGTNGQYVYVPTQAETNYPHVQFHLAAPGCLPVMKDFYPSFPQTADVAAGVDVTKINGVSTSGVTTVSPIIGSTQPLNFTGTAGNALVKTDMVDIAGAAVSTSAAQLGVNTVNIGGTAQTGRDIGASVLLSSGTGTGQVSLSAGAVLLQATQTGVTIPTVTTVTNDVGITQAGADKVWGSTTRTLSSFGTLVADAAAAVWGVATRTLTDFGFTVPATVGDKTGYSLAASQHVIVDSGTVTTLSTLPAAPNDWLTAAAVKADAVVKIQSGLIPANFTASTFASAGVFATAALANAPTGGGGGASAADVWNYSGTRSLTDKAGFAPSLSQNASQVRTELAAELADIVSIKAKTDAIPTSPAAVGSAMTLTADYDAAKVAAPAATAVADAVLDELLSAHTVAGSLAKAIADAGAADNPWDYAFAVPNSDPATTVTAGELQFQLFIPPVVQPVDVVPAPPHITLSRVYGTFELPDNTPAAKVAIQFDLVVPGDGPAKSDNIVATRQIRVTTNMSGQLVYKNQLYVDLERNDYLTPAGTTWTITSAALGFDAAPFTLAARTFDLATLIV